MDYSVLVALVLVGVVFPGGVLLWAVRRKSGAWADQYDSAIEGEGRTGTANNYPVIGHYARRLSWREVIFLLVCVAVLLAGTIYVSGCTAERVYGSAQAWQQNQCNKIPDKVEFDRCMSKANTPYESYKRQ
jgi:hypothetical protein